MYVRQGVSGLHYSNVDEEATKRNTRSLLYSYRKLKMELGRISIQTSLSGINYDGMPKSVTNRNTTEESMISELARAQKTEDELNHQISMINSTIKVLHQIDETTDAWATILEYRYIKRYNVTKCCRLLSDLPEYKSKYNGDPVPRQTFADHQNEALLAFADIYPEPKRIVVEKVRT